MRRFFLMIVVVALFLSGLQTATWGANDEETILIKLMFEYSGKLDKSSLGRLKNKIDKSDNKYLLSAYALANYIIAPEEHKENFIALFPTDYQGIMYYFYDKIEINKLTPSFLYSYEELGNIALSGNSNAIKKIFIGAIHSDGIVGELYCDYVFRIFLNKSSDAITTISELPAIERKRALLCLNMYEKKFYEADFNIIIDRLKGIYLTANDAERKTINEILSIINGRSD